MDSADDHRSDYHAFLLRLWRDSQEQRWRASLQCTTTGQRFHFGSLDELFVFIDARLVTEDGEHLAKRRPP